MDTEAAALAERANGEIRRVESQILEAREAVDNLVAAIAKGRTSRALLTALEKAEAQLATLEAKRAGMTPVVVELPANLPRVYRAQVRALAASLSHEVALGRASLALRDLIEKVVVTWDEATQSHDVAIEGRLGALLELGGARAVEVSPTDRPDTDAVTASPTGADTEEDRMLAKDGSPDDEPDGPRPPSGAGVRRPATPNASPGRQPRPGAAASVPHAGAVAAAGGQGSATVSDEVGPEEQVHAAKQVCVAASSPNDEAPAAGGGSRLSGATRKPRASPGLSPALVVWFELVAGAGFGLWRTARFSLKPHMDCIRDP